MFERISSLFWLAIPLLGLYLFYRLRYYRFKQFAGFPQLAEPSLIWGHLKVLSELRNKGDPQMHIDMLLLHEMPRLGYPPILLVDLRPITYPLLIVLNNDVAEQITKPTKRFPISSVPKSPTLSDIGALTGQHSMLTSEGEHWKAQRRRLNPGFAPQHLMTFLPAILDKTQFFLDHLDHFADTGEEFSLDELCTNLTFDVIGMVTMDLDFKAQVPGKQSELLQLFRAIVYTYHGKKGPEFMIFSYRKKWRRRRLASRLDSLLKDIIRQEYAKIRTGDIKSRSVLNLSLQGTGTLTPELIQQTSDNLRTFLFAGHDTTSILLQWAFYELSRAPRARKALFDELDELFGPNPDPAIVREKLLSNGEDILGRMTYTSAIIKETLRLHPPAGTARMAPVGSNLTLALPDGKEVVADRTVIYISASVVQRDPAIYGATRHDFVPDRWLGETEIPASAWRPFERGPRSCIGQELANVEARVILACAARRYDFAKVGVGELELDERQKPIVNEKGFYKTKSTLFNSSQVTAKPVDGTRMRVKLSEQTRAATAS